MNVKQTKTRTLYGSQLWKKGLPDNYFLFIFVSQDDLMRLHNIADTGSDDEKKTEECLLTNKKGTN